MVALAVAKSVCVFLIVVFFCGLTAFSVVTVSPVTAATYGQSSMGSAHLGGRLDDGASCIKATGDNGLILSGYTRSYGAGGLDLWLLKMGLAPYTMSNGVTGAYQREQWNKTYGGVKDDGANYVIQTGDGGYAAAGFTSSFGAGGNDCWLVKTAWDGTPYWNMTYGGPKDDAANCLIQTGDGGYLLAGYTNSGVQTKSTWLIKTDPSGNVQWSKILPGKAANSIIMTSDGEYALAVEYSDSFGLIIIDSSGNQTVNQKYVVPNGQASAQAIVQAEDGGFAIVGWTVDSTGLRGTWLVKTDAYSQEQWSKTYPRLGAFALVQTMNGGYALTGDRAFLIITDPLGNVEWNEVYDGELGNGGQYLTRMQSILRASPNHFVMAGVNNGGPYVNLQMNWIQVALKSGAELIPPETTILSPTDTVYNQRDIPLTFYVNEPTIHLMCSVNGANITIAGNATLTNLPNGVYAVTIVSMDVDHNFAPSQTVSFNVSSDDPIVLPTVVIQSPTNQVYNTKQLALNFTVDQQVLWTAYSLDGGANKTAFSKITLSSLTNGTHTVTVYAGQLPGGAAGSASVNFTVSTSTPPPPIPYNHDYPFANSRVTQQITQFYGDITGFFTSQTFLIVAAIWVAAAVGIVIIVLFISRRNATEKQSMS